MNQWKKPNLICLLAITLFPVSLFSHGDDLVLEIYAEHQSQVMPYMPVLVKVNFHNHSETDLWLNNNFPNKRKFFLRIENDENQLVYEGPAGLFPLEGEFFSGAPPIRLGRGEREEVLVLITHGVFPGREIRPIFHEPGKYQIQFTYQDRYRIADEDKDGSPEGGKWRKMDWQSEKQEIQVVSVESHLKAYQEIKRMRASILLTNPHRLMLQSRSNLVIELGEFRDELNSFVEEFGESPWTPYAYRALGFVYLRWSHLEEVTGQGRLEKAQKQFRKAMEAFPPVKEMKYPVWWTEPSGFIAQAESNMLSILRKSENELKGFIDDYPSAPWTAYAYRALGYIYLQLSMEDGKAEVEYNDKSKKAFERAAALAKLQHLHDPSLHRELRTRARESSRSKDIASKAEFFSSSGALEIRADGSGKIARLLSQDLPDKSKENVNIFKEIEDIFSYMDDETGAGDISLLVDFEEGEFSRKERFSKFGVDKILPEKLTLWMADPEGGFVIPRIPPEYSNWLDAYDWMSEAPESGFQRKVDLKISELSEMSVNGLLFFYFKTEGHYGRGVIYLGRGMEADQKDFSWFQQDFGFVVNLNKGDRNLETGR